MFYLESILLQVNCHVLAQRLVRKLCPKCREEYEITHAELKKIVPDLETYGYNKPSYKLYQAKGCLTCNNTGYKGREAVFEFLTVTEEMKRLILDRATITQVRDLAMMEGSTSLEEVLRVIV